MEGTLTGVITLPYTADSFRVCKKSYTYYRNDQSIFYGFKLSKDRKELLIPRDLVKFTLNFPEYTLKDLRISPKVSKKIKLHGLKLRDFQQKSANEIEYFWEKEHFDIVLNAETGWGKSYVISEFLSKLQLRTTILVDKTLLARQMYSEIIKLTDADVAILTKDSDIHDVNIVTYQLLQKNPDLLKKLQETSGFVVADEAHIIAADTFSSVLSGFSAKYRLALSGSMTRSDGLTDVLYDICGRSIVIGKNPEALHVHVHTIECNQIFYSGAAQYTKKISSFLKGQRSKVEHLVSYLLSKDRHIFVVVDTHDLQEYYYKVFTNLGIPSAIMNSSTSHSDRDMILEEVAKGNIKILLGMAVLEKGISIPRLDTILHLCGASTKEKTIQLIGRLKRDHSDKRTPLFIDLWFSGNLERQQAIRLNTYTNLGDALTIKTFSSYEIYKSKFN